MRKVYSISMNTDTDQEVMDYLDKVPNKSQYIKELVKKDMNNEPFTKEQLEYIRKMIDAQLKGHTVVMSGDEEQKKETAKAIDDLLNNL